MTILKSEFKKLKMADRIWRSHTQNLIIFYFLTKIGRKTITRGFLRSLKMVVNSVFEMTNPIWRPCIRFPVKIRRFSSDKLDDYYSSVSGITTNLIRNLNSANENSILRSHT